MIRSYPIVFGLLLLAFPAHAADEDAQVWSSVNATVDAGESVVLSFDANVRWTDDVSRAGQVVLRPGIGFKLDKSTTATVGYAYVRTDPVGPAKFDEHRAWQQLSYRLAGDGQNVTLTGRSRLEQRWVEGASDMGWRMRQQLRVTTPLKGKVRAVAWSEVFVSLDDTSWGQNSGLDRWRNSVGLAIPLNSAITIEPGYLNQWVVRPGRDQIHHIGNIAISARF